MREYMGEKTVEPLLTENKNRFVIFPIKHEKVRREVAPERDVWSALTVVSATGARAYAAHARDVREEAQQSRPQPANCASPSGTARTSVPGPPRTAPARQGRRPPGRTWS
jgi:hypothetical protein